MSLAWTWRQAILKTSLPATTKHVLLVISCHMNDMGEGCYPSTKTLGERCSLSERSVCSHIEDAEKAGWLAVHRHGFSGQKWARHEYMPAWPKGTESDAQPDKGTEPDDVKALNPTSKGTEPDAAYIDNIPNNIPVEHSKPKMKDSSRGLPAIRLSQFLENTGGLPPCEWGDYPRDEHGWDSNRVTTVWRSFERYWQSPDCRKPLKRDWLGTWQNWCDREAQNGRRGGGTGGTAGGGLAAAIGSFVARGEGNGTAHGNAAFSSGPGAGTDAGNDGRRYDGTDIPF
ncbi:helix-turn-helix domain-containing protein [Rhizobium leguminosarum]|uniref:helix-turn-helix domain-containing protein n=1 Tax=Rhizobium leguminosarum TaxID=384 RepID=UPI003D7AE9FA